MIVKVLNIVLIIVLVVGLLILSRNYRHYDKQIIVYSTEVTNGSSYNTFSIKQIDSLSANLNLHFSLSMLKENKPS